LEDDKIQGHVCVARYSHCLKKAVGVALVKSSLAAHGTRLSIYEDECNGQLQYAHVVSMPFYDPEGERLRM